MSYFDWINEIRNIEVNVNLELFDGVKFIFFGLKI